MYKTFLRIDLACARNKGNWLFEFIAMPVVNGTLFSVKLKLHFIYIFLQSLGLIKFATFIPVLQFFNLLLLNYIEIIQLPFMVLL